MVPADVILLGQVEEVAAIEDVPTPMTVLTARIDQDPGQLPSWPALDWTNGADGYASLLALAGSFILAVNCCRPGMGQMSVSARRAGGAPRLTGR